jgi:hypothetical protein
MTDTLAYCGPISKAVFIEEMQWHLEQDDFMQGTYCQYDDGTGFRGCAVGCSVHSINKRLNKDYSYHSHRDMAAALGWPEWLAHLADRVFEGLDDEACKRWPLELATAVPEGANLEPLRYPLMARLLEQFREGRSFCEPITRLLDQTITLLDNEYPDGEEFERLENELNAIDEDGFAMGSDDDLAWDRLSSLLRFSLSVAETDDCIAPGEESYLRASTLILEELAKA